MRVQFLNQIHYNIEGRIKQVKMFSGIKLFFFIMLFFPSITFGLLTAEIFPWAIIGTALFFKKYSKNFIYVICFFIISWMLSFFIHGPTDTIRSLASYMNTLYAFAFMVSISQLEVMKFIKLVKIIFFFSLTLGLIQYLNLIDFTDNFIKLIIPRGSSIASIESNRGVRLLASEPARAGNELIFFYLLVRYVYIKIKHRIFSDIFFALYLLVIIQSFMVFAFFAFFLVLNLKLKSIIILLFSSLVFIYHGIAFSGGRSIDLIMNIVALRNWNEILFLLANSSGNRLITIYSSYIYGVYFPLGSGLGNWFNGSIEAIKMSEIDVSEFSYYRVLGNGGIVGSRSSGFLSNLILETGIFGFLFILRYILKVLKKYWYISRDSKIVIISFLFKILFIGSVGHPIAWVVVILILRYMYIENNKNNQVNYYRNE